MKKLLLALILLGNLLALVSCKKEKDIEEDVKQNYYFNEVLVPENIVQNETSIFSLKEITDGNVLKEKLNPYKTTDIYVDCTFINQDGKEYYRPGYWTIDYNLELLDVTTSDSYTYSDEFKGKDFAQMDGIEHFNISFKPLESGVHSYKINVYVKGELTDTLEGTFNVLEASEEYKGKIVINNTNKRYFMYENTLETFIPVGFNTGWFTSTSRMSYDYDEWFKRMGEVGCNFTRIWMCGWNFGLHISKSLSSASVDNFKKRLNFAARLERVLNVAEDSGIYLLLTLNNHGQFSRLTNSEWSINPYSEIIDKPQYFFSDANCKAIYKDELRYIVGRYGTYDSIAAWELFNEVDWTDLAEVNASTIKAWHNEMAAYIKSIDCYHRLITTSYKGTLGQSFSLPNINIACIHSYSSDNAITYTAKQIETSYNQYKKIIIYAECGINASSGESTYALDPTGISVYQSMWSAIMSGSASTTMSWWWESYIHKYKLYDLYKGIAAYTKLMDLKGTLNYYKSSDSTPILSLPSSNLNFVGMSSDETYYGYIYDKAYSYSNNVVRSFNGTATLKVNDGIYKVTLINPRSGEVSNEVTVSSFSGVISFNLGTFDTDLSYIITKQ